MTSLRHRARTTLDALRQELLAERTDDGHWIGELSPSALSTATAISAFSAFLKHQGDDLPVEGNVRDFVGRGVEYLCTQQNADGGFGDTDRSHSNIATSYLVMAASALADDAIGTSLRPEQQQRLQVYINEAGGLEALRERYGKDKTFVVPIMTNLAIAGLVSWDSVTALPFEAAVFPQSMYRLLQMPVVSYAIPALVAIGQARHFHGRKAVLPLRWIRSASIGRTLKVLHRMQPESGGYLEATPLTSFVVMSLAATGRGNHEVARSGLRFLGESMTSEGSWPIDTNLATWVSSLAIHSLACDPCDDGSWYSDSLLRWHLACQHKTRHPFTGAEPGGWGWSDLSGAVPDSDDTPAAILAISQMSRRVQNNDDLSNECHLAVESGRNWLFKLQNRDGGWPTFCRGWGKLPFDRSSNDLTAHALRALLAQSDEVPMDSRSSMRIRKAIRFLEANQQSNGSWLPLWFGNQDRDDESNPVYGTSRVLIASALGGLSPDSRSQGCRFLIDCQNPDGGWGGGPSVRQWFHASTNPPTSSIEETALAVEALATLWLEERNLAAGRGVELDIRRGDAEEGRGNVDSVSFFPVGSFFPIGSGGGKNAAGEAIIRGVEFLLQSAEDRHHRVPWPIGFYFAKLWYHEKLYPLIFITAALGKYLRATEDEMNSDWPR